jgi:hypothetical protein
MQSTFWPWSGICQLLTGRDALSLNTGYSERTRWSGLRAPLQSTFLSSFLAPLRKAFFGLKEWAFLKYPVPAALFSEIWREVM